MVQSTKEFSMGRRWLMFAIVFLIAITSAYTMFKAPPLFPTLIQEVGFTESSIAWMMSMFAIIGVVLAFPAGGIFQRLGTKNSLLLAAGSLVIGSALGAFATSVPVLLASRVIEGVGMGMISVVGPAAVSTLIPKEKQGLAMGLFSIWFPLGAVLGLNLAPALANAFGWTGAWWFGLALALVAFLLALLVYQQPPAADEPEAIVEEVVGAKVAAPKASMIGIILVAIAFFCWNCGNAGAIAGFYPSFLQDAHALSPQAAGTTNSVTSFLVLILGPISGIVSDKLGTRKGLILFAMGAAAVLFTFAFNENSMTLVWAFLLLMSLPAAAMPTGVFSIVPELAGSPQKVGLGMAIVAFAQNLGIMVGTNSFAELTQMVGWNQASWYFLIPITVIGFVATIFVKEKRKQKEGAVA